MMNYRLTSSGDGDRAEKTYEFDVPVKQNVQKKSVPDRSAGPKRQVMREGGPQLRRNLPASQEGARRAADGQHRQAKRSVKIQRYRGDEARRIALAVKKKKEQQAVRRMEARERAVEAQQERNIQTVRIRRQNELPMKTLAAVLICTLLFMLMIHNMVRIKEYEAEIRTLQSQVNTLSTRRKELSDKLEQKNDLNVIEDRAVNDLGMVKADQLSRKYISLEGDDKIELIREESVSAVSRYFTDLRAFADQMGARLSQFWEYIE